jgi:hypothetical protein
MYCPKCGKENPEGTRFCMHCGADLSGYKVEISPKIEVSPKISVSTKAEGVSYPKWKPKVDKYVEIKGEGKLPVYKRFAEFKGEFFCPQCGNYDCLEYNEEEGLEMISRDIVHLYPMYECLACGKKSLLPTTICAFCERGAVAQCRYCGREVCLYHLEKNWGYRCTKCTIAFLEDSVEEYNIKAKREYESYMEMKREPVINKLFFGSSSLTNFHKEYYLEAKKEAEERRKELEKLRKKLLSG